MRVSRDSIIKSRAFEGLDGVRTEAVRKSNKRAQAFQSMFEKRNVHEKTAQDKVDLQACPEFLAPLRRPAQIKADQGRIGI